MHPFSNKKPSLDQLSGFLLGACNVPRLCDCSSGCSLRLMLMRSDSELLKKKIDLTKGWVCLLCSPILQIPTG